MLRKKQTLRLFAKDITGDIVKDRQEVTVNWRKGQIIKTRPTFRRSEHPNVSFFSKPKRGGDLGWTFEQGRTTKKMSTLEMANSQ